MRICRLFLVFALLIILTGCHASFHKGRLEESIVELCKEEYGIDVKAEEVGKTLAIFIPLPTLLDITMGINKDAAEMIQNVLLSASRVTLSTDANIEFYCVIAQDVRLPELQVIIVKYVDDVKRAFFYDISRGEYFKRTIFDININPQSKKEQTIKDVFKKYQLDPQWEEGVLEEFFRSSPIALKDFGYWQDRFYVKDITLPEFIAEQMAYRIKMRFREDKDLAKKFLVKAVTSAYEDREGRQMFNIDFDIKPNEILVVLGEKIDEKEIYENIIREITDCIYGYKFRDFSFVELIDMNTRGKLFVSMEEIYAFRKNRLTIDAILQGL